MSVLLKIIARIVYFLLMLIVVGWVIFAIYITAIIPIYDGKADAIVVLTGDTNRINTGVKLYNNNHAPYLFISGIDPDVSMNDVLAAQTRTADGTHVHSEAISRNTHENADETTKWIIENNVQSIILVTSDYHIPRARLQFKRAAPSIDIYSYPVQSKRIDKRVWWQQYDGWRRITREYIKYILTWLAASIPFIPWASS